MGATRPRRREVKKELTREMRDVWSRYSWRSKRFAIWGPVKRGNGLRAHGVGERCRVAAASLGGPAPRPRDPGDDRVPAKLVRHLLALASCASVHPDGRVRLDKGPGELRLRGPQRVQTREHTLCLRRPEHGTVLLPTYSEARHPGAKGNVERQQGCVDCGHPLRPRARPRGHVCDKVLYKDHAAAPPSLQESLPRPLAREGPHGPSRLPRRGPGGTQRSGPTDSRRHRE